MSKIIQKYLDYQRFQCKQQIIEKLWTVKLINLLQNTFLSQIKVQEALSMIYNGHNLLEIETADMTPMKATLIFLMIVPQALLFSCNGEGCTACNGSICTACASSYRYTNYNHSCTKSRDNGAAIGIISSLIIGGILILSCIFWCIYKCRTQGLNLVLYNVAAAGNIEVRAPVADHSQNQLILQSQRVWKRIIGQRIKITQDCPICQASPGNGQSSCGHLFHARCLHEWLQRNRTCPLCRKFVLADFIIICTKCGQFSYTKQLRELAVVPVSQKQVCPECK